MNRSVGRLVGPSTFVLLVALAACRGAARTDATTPEAPAAARGAGLPALRSLDEAHAAEFRRAFDESSDRARFVLALSPT